MPSGPCDAVGFETDAERFHLLVDAVTDYAIFMLSPEGRVTSWNAGAARLKSYTSAEAIGLDHSRFFTPEDRAHGLPAQILANVRQHGRHESEGWRVRKDGTKFFASAVLYRIADRQGGKSGSPTSRATSPSAKRLRTRCSKANAGSVSWSERHRLRHLHARPERQHHQLERRRRAHQGLHCRRDSRPAYQPLLHTEDRRDGTPARGLATAAREGRFEAEGWRVRKDGSRFWATVVIDAIRGDGGELIGFAKITRDITERRSRAGRIARKRAAVPPAGERRHRLRALHAGPQRHRDQLERRGANASRAMRPARSSASISRGSTPPATGLPGCRRARCRPRPTKGRFEAEGWRVRKDGTLFWANVIIDPIRDDRAGWSASPKSRATSPSAAKRRERCRNAGTAGPDRRRWRRWGN